MKDRRALIRLTLNDLYIPFYDALCKKLPPEWAPYSGLRSFGAQAALYNQGRTSPGNIVTNAKAGESAHNYGCASDWTIWTESGAPIWLEKEDPKWKEYVDSVTGVGLRSGAEFGDIDHNELKISIEWETLYSTFYSQGQLALNEAIRASRVSVLSANPQTESKT